jgi:SAM-dependent methyltransferase
MWLAEFPGREEKEAGYQDDYYSEGTATRFVGLFEGASLFFRWLRVRSILSLVPGPGAILDIGCGRGVMLGLFRKRGWRTLGTQLSKTAAEAARRLRGVEVVVGEMPDLGLPAGSFDVVTLFHVLEHLEEPFRYLTEARRVLSPSGLLVVEVPDHSGPGFRILKERHLCVDHPNHLQFFTPDSLEAVFARTGFRVASKKGFSLEYSPFTTLQNLLNLLPGEPNRFYRALMGNQAARTLRREPATWLHFALAAALAIPAGIVSLSGLIFPGGNTIRYYCRPVN